MMVIVNSRLRPYKRSLVIEGRALRAHFCDRCNTNVSPVFIHGGHGDALVTSLGDAPALARSRPRGSELGVLGDINVDELPVTACDPWTAASVMKSSD